MTGRKAAAGSRLVRLRARASLRALPLLLPLLPSISTAQETPSLHVRAGAADGEGALSPVFQVSIAPGGEILAVQPQVPTIGVFDSTGRYLRDLGRGGGGPGEFRSLGYIGWKGDTLSVMDPAGARLHLFDRQLNFLETITPVISEVPEGAFRVMPGPLMASGDILGITMTAPGAEFQPVPLLSRSGAPVRQLGEIDLRGRAVMVDLPGDPARQVTNPWDTSQLWMMAADGASIVVVNRPIAQDSRDGRFEILRVGLEGDTVFRRAFSYQPVRLGAEEADREHRRLAERLARGPLADRGPDALLPSVRRSVPAPEFYPPVRELVIGNDGSMWLRRHLPEDEGALWEVFGNEGERLRRVRLPSDLHVHGADGRRVWGVRPGELDIPYVEIYQLASLTR